MREREESPKCVEPELGALLFPYELGTLSEEDSERFEDHLFKCDACREEFQRGQQFLQDAALHRPELARLIEQSAVTVEDSKQHTGRTKPRRVVLGDWRYWTALAAAAIIVIAVLRRERPTEPPRIVQQMPADTTETVAPSPSQNDSGMVQQSGPSGTDTIKNGRRSHQLRAPLITGSYQYVPGSEQSLALATADLALDNLNFRGGQHLRITPEDSIAWNAALRAYGEKSLRQADSLAATVSKGSPLSSRALLIRGNIQLQLAEKQAEPLYRRSLQISEKALGVRRLDSARTLLQAAEAQTDEPVIKARVQWDLANVFLIKGNLDEARQSLESTALQSDFAYRDRVAKLQARIDSLQPTQSRIPKR